MRAKEFIAEEINTDILDSRFHHQQEIGGYIYTATTSKDYGLELIVKAYDGKKQIGQCDFEVLEDQQALVSNDTWVDDDYQGQGIATTMYAYAKMLGNDIVPHEIQSDAGSRMWRSWNQSKQSKYILPKGHKGYNENQ